MVTNRAPPYQVKALTLTLKSSHLFFSDSLSSSNCFNLWAFFCDFFRLYSLCAACWSFLKVKTWLFKTREPGPEVIKLYSCSTQLSTKFILLIKVKMPTIVGILTFISMINTSERLKARNFFIRQYFSFNKQLKFHAQLS